jgi:hypothetical protein
VLLTTGRWIASAKTLGSEAVHREYLKPAVDLARQHGNDSEAHLALAQFFGDLWESSRQRVTSHEWVKDLAAAAKRDEEYKAVSSQYDVAMQQCVRPSPITCTTKASALTLSLRSLRSPFPGTSRPATWRPPTTRRS